MHLGKTIVDSTGELCILQDINFVIAAGEMVAITGASGSGKSTLLGLIAGLDLPSSGTVRLNGIDLGALDEDGRAQVRAQNLGFVFQSFQLLAYLNALENVQLPLELAGAENARQRAEQMLQRVGLGERLTHYPKQLSGGEQQRVALARAFVREPKLLFADEPTGSLDAANGTAIMELMLALNREQNTTLVLVTHDVQTAAQCGRRIVLQAGRLLRDERSAA